jgi:GDP-4-dehydro-6-deoxy-D-mannose reductase
MSSAEIYGKNSGNPISESDTIVGSSPYSLSKIAMEMVGDLYHKAYQTDVIKVRSFNFIGPGQNTSFVTPYFASEIVSIEKSGIKNPVLNVGNLSAVRDFSDVRDTAWYLVSLMRQGKSGEVYNICSGKPYSIREILDKLLSLSSRKIEVKVDRKKLRPLDIPILHGDNSKIVNNFGLSPQYSIQKTLSDLLMYWRQK